MPITLKVPLANLFPVIHLPLVNPALTPIRQRASSTRPVKILSLTWSLSAGTVLKTSVSGGEIVRPFFGCGGKVRVPD